MVFLCKEQCTTLKLRYLTYGHLKIWPILFKKKHHGQSLNKKLSRQVLR